MADNSRTQSSENRSLARRSDAPPPFPAFQRDMERLFEDFFSVFGMPARTNGRQPAVRGAVMAPRMDVSETDNEIRITVDLPGIQEQDIEITLVDDVLTIRGEIKTEREETKEDFHLMERAQGAFARSLRLPFSVDARVVKAGFKDGVLSIAIPKPTEVRDKVQRIAVGQEQADSGHQGSSVSQGSSVGQSADQQRVPETAAE